MSTNYDEALLRANAYAKSYDSSENRRTNALMWGQIHATLALVDAQNEANEHAHTANVLTLMCWMQDGDPSLSPELYRELAQVVSDRIDKGTKISKAREF